MNDFYPRNRSATSQHRKRGSGLAMLGREGRGDHPMELVLTLAFGESVAAERGRNRLMRWRRREMSGHDLARDPVLGEQRDHRSEFDRNETTT